MSILSIWPQALRAPKRFAVIGEPVVAVDLINTAAAPGSPTPDDLQAADRDVQAWRRIERTRVPGGDLPDIWPLRRLHTALRALIEPLMDGRPVPRAAVADLNFFMQSAPASTRLLLTETGCAQRSSGTGSTVGIGG